MKGICYENISILGNFAGYREKRFHKSHVDFPLGQKAYCPKIN